MREIFLAPSDSTDTSLVLRAEDGEEFFLEVTDELRELFAPADSAESESDTAAEDSAAQEEGGATTATEDSSTTSAQAERSTGLHTVMPSSAGSPSSPQSQHTPQAQEIRLRPNEIQARIRAGASAAEIAEELDVPESRIEPFAHPVLLERARIADVAKQAHPIREDGPAKLTLWEILATAFAARGHSLSEATWDAYRHQGEPWILRITWKTGLSANEAEWTFKQTMSSPATVEARNSVAADLTDPDFVQPVRSLTSVGRGERYDEAIDGREDYAEDREVNEDARAGAPGVTELSSYAGVDNAGDREDTDGYAEPSVLPSPHGGEHPAEAASDEDAAPTNEASPQEAEEKETGVDEDFLQNPDPEPKPTKRRRKAVTPHWEDVLLGVRSSTKRPRE
ncbi:MULTISPECIES: septation protein SepH [unclassified Corynebacterium]|uniref:septation protein SepH n=1 Tax=unclassified Corynebacterium TaxID=2624378 RepID=UPI0008A4CAE2|nr:MULTISPECIES: septation protein SepH [unclassified Corynebacterium]OFO93248.1 DNA-binding protein [Corynebacterium sp. HMSC034H07]OFQ56806.1 DNA-binding protein [Corynebacterium sp. HMSC074H12]